MAISNCLVNFGHFKPKLTTIFTILSEELVNIKDACELSHLIDEDSGLEDKVTDIIVY